MYPAPIESLQSPTTINEVLRQLTELRGITREGRDLRIGAMTRYVDAASAPELQGGAFAAIADAARLVGDRQVRNRGTIGGSLCWNYVAACTPVAALATEATLILSSLDSAGMVQSRSVVIDDFLTGPMETAREPNELLRTVLLPGSAERSGSAYQKWGLSTATLPVIGIGIRLWVDDQDVCKTAHVAVGGLANGSQRLTAAERMLPGRKMPMRKSPKPFGRPARPSISRATAGPLPTIAAS